MSSALSCYSYSWVGLALSFIFKCEYEYRRSGEISVNNRKWEHICPTKTSRSTLSKGIRWICDIVRHVFDLHYHCLVDACCCKGFWAVACGALRSEGCYSWAIHYSWIIVNSLFKRYSYSWVALWAVIHIHEYCHTVPFNSIQANHAGQPWYQLFFCRARHTVQHTHRRSHSHSTSVAAT